MPSDLRLLSLLLNLTKCLGHIAINPDQSCVKPDRSINNASPAVQQMNILARVLPYLLRKCMNSVSSTEMHKFHIIYGSNKRRAIYAVLGAALNLYHLQNLEETSDERHIGICNIYAIFKRPVMTPSRGKKRPASNKHRFTHTDEQKPLSTDK